MKEDILLQEYLQNEDFIVKSECAISLLNTKLQIIDADLGMRYHRKVIHSKTSRIKSYESIKAKLKRKELPENVPTVMEKINDLVGVRAVCTYTDDLYQIVTLKLLSDNLMKRIHTKMRPHLIIECIFLRKERLKIDQYHRRHTRHVPTAYFYFQLFYPLGMCRPICI